jgi:predicted AAA+ superfamily ATPase
MSTLYETFVFSELMKRDTASKFWRTKSKAEVDFVIGFRYLFSELPID